MLFPISTFHGAATLFSFLYDDAWHGRSSKRNPTRRGDPRSTPDTKETDTPRSRASFRWPIWLGLPGAKRRRVSAQSGTAPRKLFQLGIDRSTQNQPFTDSPSLSLSILHPQSKPARRAARLGVFSG